MSLLLEALKRAALEKQARGEEGGQTPDPDAPAGSATLEAWSEPDAAPADQVAEPLKEQPVERKADQQEEKQDAQHKSQQEAPHAQEDQHEEHLDWDEPVEVDDTLVESLDVEIIDEADVRSGGQDFFDEIHETLAASGDADVGSNTRVEEESEAVPVDEPEPEPEPERSVGSGGGPTPTGTGFTMADEVSPLSPGLDPDSAQQAPEPEPEPEPESESEPEPRSAPGTDHVRNREALDHLLGTGRTIARRTKRRENFLYTMLLVTALGGILSYYFYLLSNNRAGQADKIVSTELVQTAPIEDVSMEAVAPLPLPIDDAALELEDALYAQSATNPAPAPVPAEALTVQAETAVAAAAEMPPAVLPPAAFPPAAAPKAPVAPRQRQAVQMTASEKSAPTPIRIAVRREPARTDVADAIGAGYQAYQTGDLAAAERDYARALVRAPGNRDALLGAAAVAIAMGRTLDAMTYYQRRLADEPDDRWARVGLLGIAQAQSNNPRFRSQLNALLQEDPRSGYLHFMKGVSLASAGQWSAAQSSFYSAYQIDSRNADYAYNLAVALDHLNQPAQARQHYQLALALASTSAASFSVDNVNTRLAELDSPQ